MMARVGLCHKNGFRRAHIVEWRGVCASFRVGLRPFYRLGL